MLAASLLRPGRAGAGDPPAPGAAVRGARATFAPCDVLLVLTGLEGGMLKPCGCSTPQRGGLPRRAALLEDARAAAAAVALVSVGDVLGPGLLPAQAGLKAELFRAVAAHLRYDALLLGPEDLLPGAAALTQPWDGPAGTPRPPRNVKLRATGALAALERVDPVARFRAGDVPVRAVSVVDPTLASLLVEEVGVADVVIPPGAALDVVPREPGLLVVAAHTMREDLAVIARKAAEKADVVVVVDVLGEAARRGGEPERRLTQPLLVTFDARGKEVAAVRLSRRDGGWAGAWAAVPLDPAYEDGPSPARDAVDALFRVYRRDVAAAGLLGEVPAVADGGPRYVGSAACTPCHEAIAASFAATPHASALGTLVRAGYDADPECVGCHVVGWARDPRRAWSRAASGFRAGASTPALGGVGCEACHGPGSAHVEDPLGTGPGRPVRSPDPAVCAACHDPENSVGYQAPGGPARYRARVDHHEVPSGVRTTGSGGARPAGR